jgi:exportin-7
MEPFVCTSVVQLLCRTVKLAWFDSDAPRAIVDECKALMERGSPGHYLLALKVLNMLVTEVNTATPGRTLTAVSGFCCSLCCVECFLKLRAVVLQL